MKTPIRSWVRGVGGVTAIVYLFTNGALAYTPESNLWTDRRRHVEMTRTNSEDNALLAALPGSSSPDGLFQSLPLAPPPTSALSDDLTRSLPKGFVSKHAGLFNALPTTHGTIRKVWLPAQNAGDRVVVHIQDVHQNEDAQRHIGGAVDALIQARQADLVALEGAFAPIDVNPFHDFKDRAVIGLTADYLLENNLITGPVHSFMTSQAPLPPLVGVDDKIQYDANVEAYRQSAPKVEKAKKEIVAQQTKLASAKELEFSPELAAFDAVVGAYKEGHASLADYVAALAPAKGVGHAGLLAQALRMEKELDFSEVEKDRKGMIAVLVKHLSKAQTDELVQESMGYRTGEVRYGEFYRYLQTLCRSVKVDLARFPHMEAYIRYVMVSDQIDGEKLMVELAALQKNRYAQLAKTETEKSLIAQSNGLHLTDRLLSFTLTPEEWKEYNAMKCVAGPSPAGLSTFEAFYQHAQLRDEDIAQNLLRSMEKGHATRAILVTGGYHTEGVSERLRAAGVTVLTFTPRIEKAETEQGSTYLSIFTQEKTPLEKLFAGEKLFITQSPGSESARETGAALVTAQEVEKVGVAEAQHIFRQLGGSIRTTVTASIGKGVVKVRLAVGQAKEAVEIRVAKVAGKLSVNQRSVGGGGAVLLGGFIASASLLVGAFIVQFLGILTIAIVFLFASPRVPTAPPVHGNTATTLAARIEEWKEPLVQKAMALFIDTRIHRGGERKSRKRIDKLDPQEDAAEFFEAIQNPQSLLEAVTPIPTRVTGFDGSQREAPLVHAPPVFLQNMSYWGHQIKDRNYVTGFKMALAAEVLKNPPLKGELNVMSLLNILLGGVTQGAPLALDNSPLTVLDATVNNQGELDQLVQTAEALQVANALIVAQGGKGFRLILTPSPFFPQKKIADKLLEKKVDPGLFVIQDGPLDGRAYTLDHYVEVSRQALERLTSDVSSVTLQYLNMPNINDMTRETLNHMKGGDDQLKQLLAKSLLAWMTEGERLFSIDTFNTMLEAAIFASQNA